MTARPTRPGPDLAGAGLVALAAACFGALGPLSRFAGDAGVDSLTLVTWRAAIGALVVGSADVLPSSPVRDAAKAAPSSTSTTKAESAAASRRRRS